MTAQHTPEIVARIREAGGIVHSDGNIFFTNLAQFLDASGGDGRDAEPVAWMVRNNFTELFTDLEEAHKYAMTIGAKVVSLYAAMSQGSSQP